MKKRSQFNKKHHNLFQNKIFIRSKKSILSKWIQLSRLMEIPAAFTWTQKFITIPRKPVLIHTKISWISLLLWYKTNSNTTRISLITSKIKLGRKTVVRIRWCTSKLLKREMTHRKTRIIQIVMMLILMNKISRWEFHLRLNSITTSSFMVNPNNKRALCSRKFRKTWATNKHFSPFKNCK